MKIYKWFRNQHGATVVVEKDGKPCRRDFPLHMTDEQIREVLAGGEAPELPPPPEPVFGKDTEPTIPEPPQVVKERLTIKQMIAELEAAGVTTVKATDKYLTIKSAYEKMKQAEAATL